jgi:mycobactin peptide synthetase MbtF
VLGSRLPDPSTDTWASHRLTDVVTDTVTTRAIVGKADAEGIEMRDVLLAALTLTITTWRNSRGDAARDGTLIALEGHGREDGVLADHGVDTSATVGWFTCVYPVRLGAGEAPVDIDTATREPAAARALLHAVAEHVAAVPNRGLDFGPLRYLRRDPVLADMREPQIEFNYLGRYDLRADPAAGDWSLITDETFNAVLPVAPEPHLPLRYAFDVISVVAAGPDGPVLRTSWRWSDALTRADEAARLGQLWSRALAALRAAL